MLPVSDAGPVKIVGLGGSLDADSASLAALSAALDAARAAGAATEVFDLAVLDLPLFRPGGSPVPADAARLADAVYEADGLLWSSPLYHGTVSGAFKNALDWLELLGKREPAYLTDKVVGLIATAGGVQGLQAINTMEFVVRALRGWAVPLVVPIARAGRVFDEHGTPRDPAVAEQLRLLGSEVVRAAAKLRGGRVRTPAS
ncbi:MAG: NAD(P)H-dependent oxidoreductase [Candidatus Sericytochromatia bacterium]|nr:NAD(P)H-dependent oxidoreductase [Candidatus Tanganyikabacteria bacterium]